ncbi:hypothetical protein BH20ACT13_BH20ACT13_23120 [soil metagenome]
MPADEGRSALDAGRERADAVARDWRQGDAFRSEDLSPLVVADLSLPLTEPSLTAAQEQSADPSSNVALIWHDEDVLVVISQDCDVVETSAREPYVTVSPVIVLDAERAGLASDGYMPRLAPIPALGSDHFADLSRVLTVEKSMLLTATRIARLRDREEMKQFRGVVHRRFSRTAFPDGLNVVLDRFLERLRRRRKKDSTEGRAVDAITEIRVRAFPSWESQEIDVTVYALCWAEQYAAILTPDDQTDGMTVDAAWFRLKEEWERLCKPGPLDEGGSITSIEIAIELFEKMTAAEYVDSDQLDLGGMSPQPD